MDSEVVQVRGPHTSASPGPTTEIAPGPLSDSHATNQPLTSSTDSLPDHLALPDLSKFKLMNLVLKLRKEMATMQQQMSTMQDNMRAFNRALDMVVEHVCDNL